MAFEKFCEDIGALFKRGRGLLAAFENSNEIKKLDKQIEVDKNKI